MIILVDMDDTIEDLMGAWLGFLREKHHLDVRKEDIREWDMHKAFPSLSTQEIYAPLFEEDMWKSVQPFQDAIEYLPRLIDDGHEVIIVTASNYDTVGMKMNYVLKRYFPFISCDNIIIASKKQMILGDVLIDDAPHNVIGGEYQGILFDAPHNRWFDAEAHGIRRAHDWSEVYSIILDIQRQREHEEPVCESDERQD